LSAATPATARADHGSFRDREGRVYLLGDRVFRGLSKKALDHFRSLRETIFYRTFSAAGSIIATRELAPQDWPQSVPAWAGFVEHQRVPFISYPYEWTFTMLRDAAILQLQLLEAALGEGWSMKDASPYNVQFVRGKPVFIDVPSFEPWRDGEPWSGYRQFCEMNLFPLMLQAYKGLHFQPFMRSSIGGIDLQVAARLFGMRDRLRPGVASHVWLQAWLDQKYGDSRRNLRSELGAAGFRRELVLANVRRLLKLLRHLQWTDARSEWGDYEEFHNYSGADQSAKLAFVAAAARNSGAQIAWDMGCNTGRFSIAVAAHCPLVLAIDADHLAVDRLFRNANALQKGHILPLVQNLADPSPNWGWNLRERSNLAARGRPGLVLCLALVHHLVIGANVPLDSVIDWLSDLGGELVIEFVHRDDEKVQQLLRNRIDEYHDYCLENFEFSLSRKYEVIEKLSLSSGLRTLYYCRSKHTTG